LLKEHFVVGCLFLKRAVVKKLVFSFKNQEPNFSTTNNEELIFFSAIATGEQHPYFVHLSLRRTKTPDILKLPVLLTVNLAPSVLLPAKVRKENPFLPCDTNPRPYPNEYGRLFFEDESGNNRMVTSERTGEWAAVLLYLETPDIPKLPVLLTVNLAPSVLLPAESY
jgi:hypothetical protein